MSNHTQDHTPRPPGQRRPGWLARLGAWSFDHPIAAVAIWLVALAGIFGAGAAIGPAFSASFGVPDSESDQGFAVLDEHFPELGAGGQSGTIVFQAEQGVDDPEVAAAMTALFDEVDAGFPDGSGDPQHPGATVISPYSDGNGGQIAREGPLVGELAYAQVNLAEQVDFSESQAIGAAIADDAPTIDGLEVLPGGAAFAEAAVPQSELIGLAFAVVILILAFGSVLAMGLPIAVAVGGVGAGVGLIFLLSNVFTTPDFTYFLGAMIGLGVGIDYALFIVTRYREGLHEGRAPRDATLAAVDTAGRSVLFAGLTVVVSLLGLLLIQIPWVSGMAIGASVTVLATMVSSITLLPALLGLVRERVEVTRWRGLVMAGFAALAILGLGIGLPQLAAIGAVLAVLTLLVSFAVRPLRRTVPHRAPSRLRETFAHRWGRMIQRNPRRWLVAGTAILVLLAAPVVGLRLGVADEGNYAEDTSTRQAYDLLAAGFGPGFNGPFVITAEAGAGDSPEDVAALTGALAATPGVAEVAAPIPDDPANPNAWVVNLVPTTSPQDSATGDLVETLRNEVIPAAASELDVKVTGTVAANIDTSEFLSGRVLLVLGAVLALSFLLLMAVFRSVLVPIKAVVMNVLSVGAAYGVVVAVFQWGWGGSLLGIEGGPIEPMLPIMLFAIVFGLSMDYEVFLLSRVRERYLRTGDSQRSVVDGLASTARVITAAAAIMVVVFGAFMFGDDRVVKLFGLGLATAVLLDATLVRMLLVPATMALFGDRNWWMPGWLDRLLPKLGVDEPDPAFPVPEASHEQGADRSPAPRPQPVDA